MDCEDSRLPSITLFKYFFDFIFKKITFSFYNSPSFMKEEMCWKKDQKWEDHQLLTIYLDQAVGGVNQC